jgi:hypothetical protein
MNSDSAVFGSASNNTISGSASGAGLVTQNSATVHTGYQSERPEKFLGTNFKRWQQKMLFYLTTLTLSRFLTEDPPAGEDEVDTQSNTATEVGQNIQVTNGLKLTLDAWNHSDFMCKNYILNGLSDTLYTVYCTAKTAKELWEKLEKKYSAQDSGTKKFIVGKFLKFQMVDSKSVMSQVQEFQMILHHLDLEGMKPNEQFLVASLIEKLPPSWNEFRSYLKLKTKEMSLEELIIKLQIQEDNKRALLKAKPPTEAKANLIDSRGSANKKRKF